jgi:hypothetical protein
MEYTARRAGILKLELPEREKMINTFRARYLPASVNSP